MYRRFAIVLTLCLVFAAPGFDLAQAQSTDRKDVDNNARSSSADFGGYVRVRYDRRRKPIALETSVTRFEGKNAQGERVTVDLIGVVHIGEPEYYEALNQIFPDYDAVLYELVAPKGTRIPRGGRVDEGLNPLAALQNGLKAVLDLEFQLDLVDYTLDNLVHADMTPEEFLASMKQNEESFAGYFLRAIGQSIAQQNSGQINQADLLLSVFADDPAVELRRVMARQMKDIESGMLIFQGRNGSTIITHRNRKALDVLQSQIDAGQRNLAIFYGAGHMPDMQQQLTDDFGMVRSGRYWLTAWKLVR